MSSSSSSVDFRATLDDVIYRVEQTADSLDSEFPHWADGRTGTWTTIAATGDWTGGAWPGMLWMAYRMTGRERFRAEARAWCLRLRPRATLETAFKGFGFYCGAAIGQILADDDIGRMVALEAAQSLLGQFDPMLGLIPLGRDAEEAGEVGHAFSSIDSLQATPLLLWAARTTGDRAYEQCARRHTTRVLDIHCRPDGSIIQSSELDPATGAVLRHFTHKGFSERSVWARAQAWGMLYAAMAFELLPDETNWLDRSMAAADWWLDHVPAGKVAYWDFDDPMIPDTEHDTAGTAIVATALLKLAEIAPDAARRSFYREAGEQTIAALAQGYVTPVSADDLRPRGMLFGGCFNKRPDSRPRDSATNAETIFGSYYFLQSLQVLNGVLKPREI